MITVGVSTVLAGLKMKYAVELQKDVPGAGEGASVNVDAGVVATAMPGLLMGCSKNGVYTIKSTPSPTPGASMRHWGASVDSEAPGISGCHTTMLPDVLRYTASPSLVPNTFSKSPLRRLALAVLFVTNTTVGVGVDPVEASVVWLVEVGAATDCTACVQ